MLVIIAATLAVSLNLLHLSHADFVAFVAEDVELVHHVLVFICVIKIDSTTQVGCHVVESFELL